MTQRISAASANVGFFIYFGGFYSFLRSFAYCKFAWQASSMKHSCSVPEPKLSSGLVSGDRFSALLSCLCSVFCLCLSLLFYAPPSPRSGIASVTGLSASCTTSGCFYPVTERQFSFFPFLLLPDFLLILMLLLKQEDSG